MTLMRDSRAGLLRAVATGSLAGVFLAGLDGLVLGLVVAMVIDDPEPAALALWLTLILAAAGAAVGGALATVVWLCRRRPSDTGS